MDEKTFEAVYDRYHRVVYGVALRVLGDRSAAEDVTQAVFLRLWHTPEAFRGGNLGAWLARVARNRAVDVLRGKARYSTTAEVSEDLAFADYVEDEVVARIDGERVREALRALPEEQSIPITMGFFGGATQQEIARRLEIPLGTIKSRIRMGLRRLRAELEATAAP